jgi:hypothetical protein
MKLLSKANFMTWPSLFGALIILAVLTFLSLSCILVEGSGELAHSSGNLSSCESLSLEEDVHEESADVMTDSVEFSGSVSKWKEDSKAILKVFEFNLPQYKPPFMEREQRPPQTSLI